MSFKLIPIGTSLDLLNSEVQDIIQLWKNNVITSKPWTNSVGKWVTVSNFLITSADYFIRAIDPVDVAGSDKKATVLDALNKIYDATVPSLLPIFIRPFNSYIKNFIFNVIVPLAIDFIVKKYHDSHWLPQAEVVSESTDNLGN